MVCQPNLVATTIKRILDFGHSNLWQLLATYSHIHLNVCAIVTQTLRSHTQNIIMGPTYTATP